MNDDVAMITDFRRWIAVEFLTDATPYSVQHVETFACL